MRVIDLLNLVLERKLANGTKVNIGGKIYIFDSVNVDFVCGKESYSFLPFEIWLPVYIVEDKNEITKSY